MLPPDNRKISDSIANPVFFKDPSRSICEALGRDFIYEVGAIALHRIGLMRGIGWRIPYGMASDGLSYVRITKSQAGPGYRMEFAKLPDAIYQRHKTDGEDAFIWNDVVRDAIEDMIWVKSIDKIPLDQLKEVYTRETTSADPAQ